MTAKYIIGSLAASIGIAYTCDLLLAEKKIFGGQFTLNTIENSSTLFWQIQARHKIS